MLPQIFDYIVVGGGLAGSVISNRLYQSDHNLNILVVEAGVDASNNTIIPYAYNVGLLVGSDLDWGYYTTPQTALNNRPINNPAGKCLGGGTAINSCGWMRGDKNDFDHWAEIVGDQRWSYDGMLPYFKKTEEYWNASQTAPGQHGFTGPLAIQSVTSTDRNFPLRDPLAEAWAQNGVEGLPYWDGNAGSPQGRAELTEDRRDGLRQLASTAYPLGGMTVLTNTLVESIVLSDDGCGATATGIKLANGTIFSGKKIIASAGTYRTPQLLMLSGIGPTNVLKKVGIKQIVNSPHLGKGLYDHLEFPMYWRLKNASSGVAIGSANPLFSQPEFGMGLPLDWVVTTTVPKAGLIQAITADEGKAPKSSHPLLKTTRSFLEHLVIYAAGSAADPVVATDGTHVMSQMVHFIPTSVGTVTINSTDPNASPVINPNYFTTEVDRYVLREGVRRMAKLMLGTPEMQEIIDGETPPDAFDAITLDATDDYLNARLKHSVFSTYHPVGTAAMGKVVDTNFNVKGVKNLKVVDASIIPTPIAAHIQAAVYAMAEQAAAIIISERR